MFCFFLLVAVGLAPLTGVLALFGQTTGTLARLFSEAVEAIDPRPVEGIGANGAHPLVEILYGVIPQVMPLWLSFTLYRFESNVRLASVVGMVGAGGIGVVLFGVIRGFLYAQTCAVPDSDRTLPVPNDIRRMTSGVVCGTVYVTEHIT